MLRRVANLLQRAGRDRTAPSVPVRPVGRYKPRAVPPHLTPAEQHTVDAFHALMYRRWQDGEADTLSVSWLGHKLLKNPLDLWIYQELLTQRQPDLVVESGTRFGGSALFLANLMDLLGRGQVVTIEKNVGLADQWPQHPRITYLTGSSLDPTVSGTVARHAAGAERVFVLLDSDHRQAHVAHELGTYADLVTPGDYLIVEDTNVNAHPVNPEHGPGPMEAVDAFLAQRPDFVADRGCERFLFTQNPRGFLRRTSP